MKFDLFDAIANMRRVVGPSAEITVFSKGLGVEIRLSAFKNGRYHHSQFSVLASEIISDAYIDITHEKFKRNMEGLRRLINGK